MPKKAPELPGIHADSYQYKSGYSCYRIIDSRLPKPPANQVLFESHLAETRDYVMERMLASN